MVDGRANRMPVIARRDDRAAVGMGKRNSDVGQLAEPRTQPPGRDSRKYCLRPGGRCRWVIADHEFACYTAAVRATLAADSPARGVIHSPTTGISHYHGGPPIPTRRLEKRMSPGPYPLDTGRHRLVRWQFTSICTWRLRHD